MRKSEVMKAVKIKGFAKAGILSLAVPEAFYDKPLEVIVVADEVAIPEVEVEADLLHRQKGERLMKIIGKAEYSNQPVTKYDVYDQ